MSEASNNKRIDEISMMRGLGMVMVIIMHMCTIAGAFTEHELIAHLSIFLSTPVMMMFFYVSGYTSLVRMRNPFAKIAAYIGGFWHEYLYDPVPRDVPSLNYMHFAILMVSVFVVCGLVVRLRTYREQY